MLGRERLRKGPLMDLSFSNAAAKAKPCLSWLGQNFTVAENV